MLGKRGHKIIGGCRLPMR